MKIQCSCGAKYVFEAAPEMLDNPVRFICSACGLDASEYVNSLVRQEFAPESEGAEQPAAQPQAPPASTRAPQPSGLHVRIHKSESIKPIETLSEPDTCPKHYGVAPVARCFVCSKPICPKCMELFGYVCSPLCKAKADSHGITVPVFEGQRSRIEARRSKNIGRIAAVAAVLLVALLGVWIWYEWWGCEPKPIFSVRFPEMAYSGQSEFGGKDQIVFIHGETLARHDLKQNKQIWSRAILDQKQIEADVAAELKWYQSALDRANKEGRDEDVFKIPPRDKLLKRTARAAAAQLVLRVRGTNVWVSMPGKLVRYDWDTGAPGKEITMGQGFAGLIPRGDEITAVETGSGWPKLLHINLTNSETRIEDIGGGTDTAMTNIAGVGPATGARLDTSSPGVPKPLDPAKVAAQAQHLSYPARLALPAVLATKLNQERALAEMKDTPPSKSPAPPLPDPSESSSVVPTSDGLVLVSVRLIESRITQRSAMKAAPAKSALEGQVSAAQTTEIANEILNEMQRSRGGDIVTEDESRYQVTIRKPGEPNGWTGEVIGEPTFFPLQSVNVLAANKGILVFDKSNKFLWKGLLNYNVSGDLSSLDAATAQFGQGPVVERNGSLYVFDEGVLTAFDMATGNARWRLPSVGISGLFFDDEGKMYVNTTTAGIEKLKNSRQIDVSDKTESVVLKLDCKTGKTIWSAEMNGLINHVSGKYVFLVRTYQPYEPEEDDSSLIQSSGRETPPYLRIKRINPKSGREMWEHFQQRSPLDIQFDKNTIRLVFRKEVQVLRFPSF